MLFDAEFPPLSAQGSVLKLSSCSTKGQNSILTVSQTPYHLLVVSGINTVSLGIKASVVNLELTQFSY